MDISQSWVEIATGECILTKHGTKPLMLAYSSGSPTTEDTMGVSVNIPQRFPLVAGKTLWAKAPKTNISITVEII